MVRTYEVNKRLRDFINQNDKRPTRIADKAGIRRDTFSLIINCKRPVYADEVLALSKASGASIAYLFGEETVDSSNQHSV